MRHGLEDGLEAWGREGGMGLRHGGEGWLGLEAWWTIKRERKNQGREGGLNLQKREGEMTDKVEKEKPWKK